MEKQYDVVVVGAGPAGLSAAIAAAESGGRILILDNNPQAGGQIWRAGPIFPVPEMAQQKYQQIKAHPNIEFMFGSKIVAAPFGQLQRFLRCNSSMQKIRIKVQTETAIQW